MLRYYPANDRRMGSFRKIEVRLMRPGSWSGRGEVTSRRADGLRHPLPGLPAIRERMRSDQRLTVRWR